MSTGLNHANPSDQNELGSRAALGLTPERTACKHSEDGCSVVNRRTDADRASDEAAA